jgi:hypothetical protein
MKYIIVFAYLLFAAGTQAQSRGYLITMNDNDTIGVVGGKIVIFTQELDDELKTDIAKRFNKKGKYLNRNNTKMKNKRFENDYYNYSSVDNLVYRKQFNASVEIDDVSRISNTLAKTSGKYLLSEVIQITGGAIGLSLLTEDPTLGTQVLVATTLVATLLRLSGHYTLGAK